MSQSQFLRLICLGLCFFVGTLHGQVSTERLERITQYLQSEVDARHVAGAVGLLARHGEVKYFEAVGDELNTDSLFRIASMTKAITSVATLSLVEEGAIALDDPVSDYLPSFAHHETIPTIHQLLTHTSGIGYGWFGPESQDIAYRDAGVNDLLVPSEDTLAERVEELGRLPLAFEPGEQWAYGMSTDALGRVIEVVSDLSLETFFQERVFRRLDMTDTHFYVPDSKQSHLAPLFTPNEDKSELQRVGSQILEAGPIRFSADFCMEGAGNLYAGGSGLVSSTQDYFTFLQTLLDGGGSLLSAETVTQMTTNQIGDLSIHFPGHGDGFGYGFGVLTERGAADDITSVGTYSWGGIFNTYYWVDPQEEMIGILMTQVFPNDHLNIRQEFKRLAYEALDDSGWYREYWYEQGLENGNPYFNNRQLRVNAPEVSVHETFSQRSEPRSSGMARILIDEDLRSIRRADLYTEIWGGHPGTANKRVNVNGRHAFAIPEVGTQDHHCAHQYPSFHLKPTDLVNGYNSLQFACDQGSTFWGHYIVDNACLKIGIEPPLSFEADVRATQTDARVALSLDTESDLIESVTYQGRYFGYDENGNQYGSDWHGMTKGRKPYAMLGTATEAPFSLIWDTSMLPDQANVQVKAFVRFKGYPDLVYETRPTGGLNFENHNVSIHHVDTLPTPFWSRAGRKIEAGIDLNIDPKTIQRAELHVVAWTGGPGEIQDYFTLNGVSLPVAEGHDHQVHYSSIPIEPSHLRNGRNEITLLSDTEHHGIEILRPGPALIIKTASD